MKRILLLLTVLISISVAAQTFSFRTTSFTFKINEGHGWSDWYPYQNSNILVTINLDTDVVTINSSNKQIYYIIDYLGEYTNSNGNTLKFKFIDQDYDYGIMRLTQRTDGRSEIYIEFNNVIWVYSVIRI